MKSFILPFVVALIAGIGVAGGAAVLIAKPAPKVVADDSSKHSTSDTSAIRVIDSSGAVMSPGAAVATPADSQAHAGATKVASAVTPPSRGVAGVPAVPTPVGGKPAGIAPSITGAATGPLTLATASAKTTIGASATPAVVPPAEKRISRVIAAMAPRDAAKVLTQMADHDVAIIIGNLSEKQEAAILAALPADRLASVSKLLLKPAQAPK